MTILGLKSQLLSHFASHDVFDPSKHVVTVDSDTASYGKEMLGIALGQLEEIGLIKKLTATESPVWVLLLPLNLVPQAVYIERDLAISIAACIEHYNEMEDVDVGCDPAKIDSADIARLLDIIGNWEDDEEETGKENGGGGSDLSQYEPGVN